MRRAILHIGIEKTGTSALQTCLARNRSVLRDAGVIYPSCFRSNNSLELAAGAQDLSRRSGPKRHLGIRTAAEAEALRASVIASLEAEVSRCREMDPLVILSAEHCSSSLTQESEIMTLKRLLDRVFEKVEIVVYLRRQDELAVSAYSTRLKSGGRSKRVLPEKELSGPYYNFDCLLGMWANVFGNENIRPAIYSSQTLIHGDLIDDFVWRAGLPKVEGLRRPPRKNAGLSFRAQEFVRVANSVVGREGARRVGISVKQSLGPIAQRLEGVEPGPGRLPRKEDAKAFAERFSAGNECVRKQWFPDRESLFDNDFSRYPEEGYSPNLTFEDGVEIGIALCRKSREEECRQKGLAALRDGQRARLASDLDRSVEQFRLAAGLLSDHPSLHKQLSEVLLRKGDLIGAYQEARKAVRMAPESTKFREFRDRVGSEIWKRLRGRIRTVIARLRGRGAGS